MQRTPVQSSNIRSVGFDSAESTLEVEFQNGKVWQYAGVSQETHASLLKQKSIGSAFNATIVKGGYKGVDVTKDQGKPQ